MFLCSGLLGNVKPENHQKLHLQTPASDSLSDIQIAFSVESIVINLYIYFNVY